ncbi:NAD(P)H-flavin reductase (plasmid) [Vibrio nigripulchritudo]|uniref:NAD(P)H-flavin reductase n=1 Tax=Vibrio nigripulchritudo TaxID=28173 RepID=UPI00190A76C0|nr:NAD(P)H-flavin reductase [Vibrio nigripulchritudo]BCL73908.1 NAD(P)H-flavin reductase [Vibrio nigripulchritudo]BDU35284.1 NAD(P)H-flavin reductase [Vibrio nigripulchritudo]
MSNIKLSVVSSEPLNQHVQKVMLKPSSPLEFQAGQYMALAVDSDDCRYYSIASPEMDSELIELHIESTNTSKKGLEKLLESKQARLVKLGGEAVLRKDSCAPVLLVAGGVGFSYVRSILLSSLSLSPNRDVHVYWVARDEKQLYALEELNDLVDRYQNLRLTTVVKTENSPRGIDLLFEEIKLEYRTLAHSEVYISGKCETSHILRERLTRGLGAVPQNIFSDAFS